MRRALSEEMRSAALAVRRTLSEEMRSAALVLDGIRRPRQPVSRLPVISSLSRSPPSTAEAAAVAVDRFSSVVVVDEQALQRWFYLHLRWRRLCCPAEFLELVVRHAVRLL